VVNSLKSSVSWGSVSTRTFHDDWKQTSLRPQAESAKVASSSDENRTGDNSSNLATVINGPGTEDFHYTRSSASRAMLLNNFLSGKQSQPDPNDEVLFLDKLEIVTRLSRSKGLAPVTNVVSPPLKDSAGLVVDRSDQLFVEVPFFLGNSKLATRLTRSKDVATATNVVSEPLEDSAAPKRFSRRGKILDKKRTSNNTLKHKSVMNLKTAAGQQQKTDQNVGQCIRRSVPSLRVCNLVNSPRSSSKQIESFQKEVQQKPAENNTGFKRKRTSDNLLKQPIAIDLKPGAVVLFAMFSLYFGIY